VSAQSPKVNHSTASKAPRLVSLAVPLLGIMGAIQGSAPNINSTALITLSRDLNMTGGAVALATSIQTLFVAPGPEHMHVVAVLLESVGGGGDPVPDAHPQPLLSRAEAPSIRRMLSSHASWIWFGRILWPVEATTSKCELRRRVPPR